MNRVVLTADEARAAATGTLAEILFVPGSCDSLGDLSRKIARAYGRDWPKISMSECDAWHAYTARLVSGLFNGWRGHPC